MQALCGLRAAVDFRIRGNYLSHGREASAAELGGEYQDPGRGAGLFRKMADGAPDKGLTGGGGGTLDLSRGWRPGVYGRRMRAPGLSQDSGRGAEGIRDGDAGKWYRDKAAGRGPGRENRPPRDAGGSFPSRLRREEDFFRKRAADAV